MAEKYSEYRRREARHTSRRKPSGYLKKLKTQIIVSVLCLSSIYFLKSIDTDLSNSIENRIKSALSYEVDLSGFTDFVSNLLNSNGE